MQVNALTLQMLEWIGTEPRAYAEVMAAWRTSCPRLSIWEDACIDGLVTRDAATGQVTVSAKGEALLRQHRRPATPQRASAAA